MPRALLLLILCSLSATAWAQPRPPSTAQADLMAPRGTPIAVFNLPVTAHGYSVASPAHQRTLNAVDFTIRPETATVFGFRLASPAADALLTLTYDLVSQQLRGGSS
ncbi:MAG: hypothetical protein AAF730_12120 [Bacteroidota bacterium]